MEINKYKLIIVHGWAQNKTHWQIIEGMFKKDMDVLSIDLPGFGEEKLINDSWTIKEYSEWLENKLINLNNSNIILLGHSFGGRISSFLASKNPEYLKGLVLFGSPSIYRPSLKVKILILLAKFIKKIGLKKYFESKNEELIEADQNNLGKIFRNAISFDQTENLKNIDKKTLLIWGENDDVVNPKIAKEMQKLIKNSELFFIKSTGHNAYKENPYLFYGTVKKFIENI
jgi:pimeloyl-ACP methyl ester carboxylesterase